jgi:hypothetical protein
VSVLISYLGLTILTRCGLRVMLGVSARTKWDINRHRRLTQQRHLPLFAAIAAHCELSDRAIAFLAYHMPFQARSLRLPMSPPQPRGSSLGTNSVAHVPGSTCKVLQGFVRKNLPSDFPSGLPPYPMNCLLVVLVAVHRLGLRPPPFFMYVFPAFVNSISYDPIDGRSNF